MKQVKILTACVPASYGNMTPDHILNIQKGPVKKLGDEVNDALRENPTATVQWLQSSAASVDGHFSQITAIVNW